MTISRSESYQRQASSNKELLRYPLAHTAVDSLDYTSNPFYQNAYYCPCLRRKNLYKMGSTAQEMNTPKRILQVFTILNHGGAEAFIMNHYRKLDRTKVQFDFLVHREDRGEYEDDIERMGGRIFRTCSIRPGHYLKIFSLAESLFQKNTVENMPPYTRTFRKTEGLF